MILTADLSKLSPAMREAIVKNLQHEDAAQLAIERTEQAKLAKFYRDHIQPGVFREGMGPMHSVVHVGLQQRLAAQYGHEVAWQDPEFRDWLLKHEEAFRVPIVRSKISSGWTPEAGHAWRGTSDGKNAAPRLITTPGTRHPTH